MKIKESETVELKKSVAELKDALKSVSAILNKHQKGELYFGLTNENSPYKNSFSEKTLRDISQTISNEQPHRKRCGIRLRYARLFTPPTAGLLFRNRNSSPPLAGYSCGRNNKIEPRIYPLISIVPFNSIDIIKVVFEGHQVPYSAEGRYFIRVADEDKQILLRGTFRKEETKLLPMFLIEHILAREKEEVYLLYLIKNQRLNLN